MIQTTGYLGYSPTICVHSIPFRQTYISQPADNYLGSKCPGGTLLGDDESEKPSCSLRRHQCHSELFNPPGLTKIVPLSDVFIAPF
jgi:hypothetical protein